VRAPLSDFAISGANPAFAELIPFGQFHVPSETAYRQILERIDGNGYFTNHGPLARELEQALAEFLGVAHAVVCTNETLGLAMALKAMDIRGGVLVPALGFPEMAEAVVWAGLEPVFSDVDPDTHQLGVQALEEGAQRGIGAAIVLEVWGNRCDSCALVDTASSSAVKLIFYAPDGFGTARDGQRITSPDQPTVFSFHSSRLLSTGEGGCLATDNGDLAAALRNIRSSYGAGHAVPVPVTANGRFSELQAGLALWSLAHLDEFIEQNEALCASYRSSLAGVDGLTIYEVSTGVSSNNQSLVLLVDEESFGLSRDGLLELLRAENVDARRAAWPGLPSLPAFEEWASNAPPCPVAERLAEGLIQLPVGSGVTPAAARQIGELVAAAGGVSP
jgi:dTDP-4-amino-4,6-dideoxygalactose transaminase